MDLLRPGVKEPSGLDHLQRFVEHRGRIHGDLRAHRPVGMRQRLGQGGVLKLLQRVIAERAARGCQQNARVGIALRALQALIDGAVLAVHGNQGWIAVILRAGCHDNAPARDQRFFVGQQHAAVCPARSHHGRQAHHAHHRYQHIVAGHVARGSQQRILAKMPIAKAQIVRDLHFVRRHAGQARHAGAKRAYLRKQRIDAAVRCQGVYFEFIGMQCRNLQRLRADGAGAAQDIDYAHERSLSITTSAIDTDKSAPTQTARCQTGQARRRVPETACHNP